MRGNTFCQIAQAPECLIIRIIYFHDYVVFLVEWQSDFACRELNPSLIGYADIFIVGNHFDLANVRSFERILHHFVVPQLVCQMAAPPDKEYDTTEEQSSEHDRAD